MASTRNKGDHDIYAGLSRRDAQAAKRAKKSALEALRHYGKPTMSLEELRAALAAELGDRSLSDFVIAEREAGW